LKSIKTNAVLNSIRTGSLLFFALVSFPYISRIFGPTGLGNLTFASSFIGYFTLFATIGIPLYGIREVSRTKDKRVELVSLVRELMIIQLVMSLLVLSLLALLIFNVGFFQNAGLLYFVFSLTLISSPMMVEWVFEGLEEYRYLTWRTVLIGLLSLVSIFCFVNDKNDLVVYSIILVSTTFITALSNIFFLRHLIFDVEFSELNFKRHLKPLFSTFLLSLLINIYVQLDIVILGVLSNPWSVGLYSAALKINKVALSLIMSISAVLLPRLSFYAKHKMEEDFDRIIIRSFSFILVATLPLVTLMCLMSESIIMLVAGENYLQGSLALVLTSPIILMIGVTNIIGMQILYPLGLEGKVTVSVFFGALSFIVVSLFLIPRFSHNGAAISSLVSEIVVLLVQFYYLPKKYFQLFSVKLFMVPFVSCIVMIMSIYSIKEIVGNSLSGFFIKIAVGCSLYVLSLFLLKDKFATSLFILVKNKFIAIKQ
jgi:O-antigen/teichoic acid export membrane protein